MGVPAFFRWLSLKYPSIVSHCIEEKAKVIDDTKLPVDTSQPNPNKIEFDNLYLDMNNIIHPCTHPENKPAPKNEDEMFVEIFLYIDRIFSIIRPRKLIYMAVDGVAPRAKMNQQRSRRFRAGKESREKRLTIEQIRSELIQKGAKLPDPKDPSEHFDSNCITPGTPFMARLASALQYYVYMKLNSDPGWKNIQVILSDASVPGEGEHKIMDFIRRQRDSPTHDPNTKHCLCGADADLIMLGLATHEPYFTVIREEFKPNQPKPCEICGQLGHLMTECEGMENIVFNTGTGIAMQDTEFIFIHLNVLREYLQQELVMPNLPFQYDFERAVDDWVFMCFFVGNDFLPHLPSLEIREKAIDRLVRLYKTAVYKTKGWLTDSGKVNLSRVQLIMRDLALVEDEIFKNRRDDELQFRRRSKMNKNRVQRQRLDDNLPYVTTNAPEMFNLSKGERFSKSDIIRSSKQNAEWSDNSSGPSHNVRGRGGNSNFSDRNIQHLGKRKFVEAPDEDDLKNEEMDKKDEVKLWETGYRKRYYQSKFGVDVDENNSFCQGIAHQYVRGLCWVLAYYYQGCQSWTWFYPYHYAPFAIDFVDIENADVEFQRNSKPFYPLEQLMGVFPADSKSHVPPSWQSLMTDPDSPVIDFYPTNFKIDLNGKKFEWMGVALLPFVNEKRLLKALGDRYDLLTQEEVVRNAFGPNRYYVRSDHPVASLLQVLYEAEDDGQSDSVIDPQLTIGVSGRIWKDKNLNLPGSTVEGINVLCEDIRDVRVIGSFFKDPQFHQDHIFMARLLPNVKMPPATIGPNAIKEQPERRKWNTGPMQRMVHHSLNNNRSYNNISQQSSSTSDLHRGYDKQQQITKGFTYENQETDWSIHNQRNFQIDDSCWRQSISNINFNDNQQQNYKGNNRNQFNNSSGGYHGRNNVPEDHRYNPYGQQHSQRGNFNNRHRNSLPNQSQFNPVDRRFSNNNSCDRNRNSGRF